MLRYIVILTALILGGYGLKTYYEGLEKPCALQPDQEDNQELDQVLEATASPEPEEGKIHQASIDNKLAIKEAQKRYKDIGFQGEKTLRPFETITKRLSNSQESFQIWYKNLKNFLVLYADLSDPSKGIKGMGVSEAVDLLDQIKYAICDEVAQIHFMVKDGLDPMIGQEWPDSHNVEVTKEERIILEILYRSCRMTAEHAMRQTNGLFARVTFAPTPEDWAAVKTYFDIK